MSLPDILRILELTGKGTGHLAQGSIQVLPKILYILESDGKPHQPIADAVSLSVRRIVTRVGHGSRLFDQGFDSPQAHRQLE